MALTAFERAQELFPRTDTRPKITHCTLINDDLLRRIKAIGAVPALFTTYAYYNTDKFHFYGEERMKRSMAYRTLLDAGIPVAAGSDFSPGPFAPLMGIQGMVTRTGWNRRPGEPISESALMRHYGSTPSTAHTLPRRGGQGIDFAGQAGGLRRAGRRSSHCGQGENQGYRDRADSHRRRDGLPEVTVARRSASSRASFLITHAADRRMMGLIVPPFSLSCAA